MQRLGVLPIFLLLGGLAVACDNGQGDRTPGPGDGEQDSGVGDDIRSDTGSNSNPDQSDSDGNGVGDACTPVVQCDPPIPDWAKGDDVYVRCVNGTDNPCLLIWEGCHAKCIRTQNGETAYGNITPDDLGEWCIPDNPATAGAAA